MEIDPADVLDLLRQLREEPDPMVRFGMYYAAVILGLVADEPEWVRACSGVAASRP